MSDPSSGQNPSDSTADDATGSIGDPPPPPPPPPVSGYVTAVWSDAGQSWSVPAGNDHCESGYCEPSPQALLNVLGPGTFEGEEREADCVPC